MYPITTWFFILIMISIAGCGNNHTETETHTSDPIRVMTYNIHHANPPSIPDSIDIDAIAAVIREANPDLVALQEVDVFTERSGKSLHQARALAEKLNMNYYFTKALDYQGGYYGNAVLSTFPILDSLRIELPTLEGVQAEDRVWGGIKFETDGKEMWFGSTHLDFQRGENNVHQSRTLLENLEAIRLPVIIGGDFNRTPESETIELFDTQFQRTCSECPPTIPVSNPNRTIDHLMFRPKDGFSITDHRVIDEQYASDHLPVVAELLLE